MVKKSHPKQFSTDSRECCPNVKSEEKKSPMVVRMKITPMISGLPALLRLGTTALRHLSNTPSMALFGKNSSLVRFSSAPPPPLPSEQAARLGRFCSLLLAFARLAKGVLQSEPAVSLYPNLSEYPGGLEEGTARTTEPQVCSSISKATLRATRGYLKNIFTTYRAMESASFPRRLRPRLRRLGLQSGVECVT